MTRNQIVPTVFSELSLGSDAVQAQLYGPSSFVLNKNDVVELHVNNFDAGKHPLYAALRFPGSAVSNASQPSPRAQVPDRAQVAGLHVGRSRAQPAARRGPGKPRPPRHSADPEHGIRDAALCRRQPRRLAVPVSATRVPVRVETERARPAAAISSGIWRPVWRLRCSRPRSRRSRRSSRRSSCSTSAPRSACPRPATPRGTRGRTSLDSQSARSCKSSAGGQMVRHALSEDVGAY